MTTPSAMFYILIHLKLAVGRFKYASVYIHGYNL